MNGPDVVFLQNPAIDLLFGHMGVKIPSKREDFKPIAVIVEEDDGTQKIVDDFYIRRPDSKSVRNFQEFIRKEVLHHGLDKRKILHPKLVEVIVAITITQKQFFRVDVDNIAKTILDSLKGLLFDDDSQVSSLICRKDIHPLNMNGFFIGLTELNDNRRGIIDPWYLYSEQMK